MLQAEEMRLRKEAEDEKQFELAKRLHSRTQSPLALEQICFNFLEKTWPLWVSACNHTQQNFFNDIRKYEKIE